MSKKRMGRNFQPVSTEQASPDSDDVIVPDAILVPAESNRPSQENTVEDALRERKPLTAADIAALPYKERPPRSEWPLDAVKDNPRPYKKRRGSEGRTYGSSIGHIDFVSIFGFLILWAACSGVEYLILGAMGLVGALAITMSIVLGLITAGFILLAFKGGGFGGTDFGNWY